MLKILCARIYSQRGKCLLSFKHKLESSTSLSTLRLISRLVISRMKFHPDPPIQISFQLVGNEPKLGNWHENPSKAPERGRLHCAA